MLSILCRHGGTSTRPQSALKAENGAKANPVQQDAAANFNVCTSTAEDREDIQPQDKLHDVNDVNDYAWCIQLTLYNVCAR